MRELIARPARENSRWASQRIRSELLKFELRVGQRSIRRYRGRGPARPPSQTWRTLYVVLCITHARRQLVHVHVTASPTAAWLWQQVREATPWDRQPRYLLRDRDAA